MTINLERVESWQGTSDLKAVIINKNYIILSGWGDIILDGHGNNQ